MTKAGSAKFSTRLLRLLPLLACMLAILPGCREKEEKNPASAAPPAITRSRNRSLEIVSRPSSVPEANPDPYAAVNLMKLTDSGIADLAKMLIESGNPTPESENGNRLENCLAQLARRNGSALYDVISQLPPGWHSERLVSTTFMNMKFASFADALAKAGPIKESDLYRAALEGAFTNYRMACRTSSLMPGGEMKLGVDIPQLRELKGNGISDEIFSKLLISGAAAGDFELSDILPELDLGSSRGNAIMSDIVSQLPAEAVKKAFEEAITRGDKLDLASVFRFASSLAHEDPEESIAWIATLPGENAFYATRSFFYEWTAAAPRQASARIGAMEPGPLKDAAVEGLIRNSVANGAFDDAEEWMPTIRDEAVRKRANDSIEKARGARQLRK